MDTHILELLKDKIDDARDTLKNDIFLIRLDVSNIRTDVNELLSFKWKIAGMAVLVGVVSGAVFEFVVRIVFRA